LATAENLLAGLGFARPRSSAVKLCFNFLLANVWTALVVVDQLFLRHRVEMLFEVTLRITVAPGQDGVTPEERADGFKSEWASLLIPMPQARAISLAKLRVGLGVQCSWYHRRN